MRPFLTFGAALVCGSLLALPVAAQHGGRSNALGGPLAGQGAMNHPLGGFIGNGPALGGNRGNRGPGRAGQYGYPYGYSFYVPNYFDYLDADSWYDSYGAPAPTPVYAPAPVAAPPIAQPVIINQYFGIPGPQAPNNGPDTAKDTETPRSANRPSPAYYLIAYKNHSVYSAVAYWVQDKTLHYMTSGNVHNQASLDLIDLDLTRTLNQANDVPFTVPGQ